MKNKMLDVGLLLNKIIAVLLLLIILFVIILLFVISSDNKIEKNSVSATVFSDSSVSEIEKNKGNIVISYESSPSYGPIRVLDNHYIINVYDNLVVEYGYINDSKLGSKDLSKETYEEVYNYAFSDAFTDLEENLTDEGVMDGSADYITIFFNDGVSKKVGGYSPSDIAFKELESMLLNLTKI